MANDDRVITTTIDIDGESREVAVPVPDGYLTPREIGENYVPKDSIEARIGRAKSAAQAAARDRLIEDDEFLAEVAKKRKDKLVPLLGLQQGTGEHDIERMQEAWREAELKPATEKLTEAATTIDRLRTRALKAEVLEAAAASGIRDSMLDVVPIWVRDRVAYDDEHDGWFVIDGTGEFEFTAKPQRGAPPFKTVAELIEDLHRAGTKPDWFKSNSKPGIDFKGGDRRTSGKLTVEEFDGMTAIQRRQLYDRDPDQYRELMAAKRDAATEALGK